MRLRPNDSPCLELNEIRTFTFNIATVSGSNTISGTPTVTSPNLTVGTVTKSGLTITAPVTASQTGTHMLKVEADLSSSETLIGYVRVKVIDSSLLETPATRYDT